jgi:hypothetical protein
MALITALSVPLMILNIIGGIVLGIWLVALHDWNTILLGIVLFLLFKYVSWFALWPSTLLALLAAHFAEKRKAVGMLCFNSLSNLYSHALVTVWCCGVLVVLVKDASAHTAVPRLVWSYGVATGPWAYMASVESGLEGEGSASTLATFVAKLAYLVVMLLAIFSSLSFRGAIMVFAGFMLVGFVIQIAVSIFLTQRAKEDFV